MGEGKRSDGRQNPPESDGKPASDPPSPAALATSDDDTGGSRTESSSFFGSDDSRCTSSSGDMLGVLATDTEQLRLLQMSDVGAAAEEEKVAEEEEAPAVVVRKKCIGRSGSVSWGSSSMVGRRSEMEDDIAAGPAFLSISCEDFGGCTAAGSPAAVEPSPIFFFGVYDGHGGAQVAKYCGSRLHEALAEQWGRRTETAGHEGSNWKMRWEEALDRGFKRVDGELAGEFDEGGPIAPEIIGSTAVVVLVSRCQIVASNCGDSRAVLCRGGQAIPLTSDHKPNRADELARIEAAGGRVINWYGPRVNGVLAMSRAIGDRYFRPCIIPDPEVTFTERSADDDCLIVASDGLWDVLSNDEVCRIARLGLRRLKHCSAPADGPSPTQAVADHLTSLAYQRSSCDNISVIVVDLKARRTRRRQADPSSAA
ncbi:probable protein phosphatase 2C 6 isoform X1 [Nymphaea colorata]|nr:probable protein phosphatase 2C 6 isoform X1 [Nymphaea colorata]